jgi:hypothetical protein
MNKKISTKAGIAAIVVVAIIIGTLIWFWQKTQTETQTLPAPSAQENSLKDAIGNQNASQNENQVANQIQSAQPTTIANETDGSKTYMNTKFGYSVDYPGNWFAYTSDSKDVFFQPEKEGSPDSIPGPHANALEINISPLVVGTSLDVAVRKYVKDTYDFAGIGYNLTKVTIGGINGIKAITTCEGVGCGQPDWFLAKNNNFYRFSSNLGDSKEFEKIVASFKFTK